METKHFRHSGFAKIDKALGQTAKRYHLEAAVNRYKVLKGWRDVAGSFLAEAAELTKATDFSKGVLRVACLSRELGRELMFLLPRIIQALNSSVGRQVVFAVRLEI